MLEVLYNGVGCVGVLLLQQVSGDSAGVRACGHRADRGVAAGVLRCGPRDTPPPRCDRRPSTRSSSNTGTPNREESQDW